MRMTTNASGTQRRGPPPLPGARVSTSTQGAGSPPKQTGKLAQLPDPDETLITSVHSTYPGRSAGGATFTHRATQPFGSNERTGTAPAYATSGHAAPGHTAPNEPSRTLSQDMRREVQDIVRLAVERALAPQLERVRQLERDLADLRRERVRGELSSFGSGASASSANPSIPSRAAAGPGMTTTAVIAAATSSGAHANFAAHAAPAAAMRSAAPAADLPHGSHGTHAAPTMAAEIVTTADPYATFSSAAPGAATVLSPVPAAPATSTQRAAWSDPSAAMVAPGAAVAVERPTNVISNPSAPVNVDLDDIEWELNGSRRRKVVGWLFGILVFVLLALVGGAAILSHYNIH